MATEEEKQAELLAQARRRIAAGEDIRDLTREQAAAYQAAAEAARNGMTLRFTPSPVSFLLTSQ